jgi:hypothetical protein
MEVPHPIPPIELLKNDPIFEEVLRDNPWAVTRLEELAQFDIGTFNHSVRVARLYTTVAVYDTDPPALQEAKKLAGLLHDWGKIKTDPLIVHKPGTLSEEELAVMDSHVQESRVMVWPHNVLAAKIIASHHESQSRPYPRKVIRITDEPQDDNRDFALCDSLDGMWDKGREYRDGPVPEEIAFQVLKEHHPEQRIREVMDAWKDLYGSPNIESSPATLV